MSGKTESHFIPSTEVSTRFYCDDCSAVIDRVCWKQCAKCEKFDLCKRCVELPFDQLKADTRTRHNRIHEQHGFNEEITADDMKLIMVEDAERRWDLHVNEKREEELKRMLEEQKIKNDYDMAIVTRELYMEKQGTPSPYFSALTSEQKTQINSMVVDYYIPSSNNTVRVLSLDGGGVRGYLSVKVLEQLIKDQSSRNLDLNLEEDQSEFLQNQEIFIDQFDYFAGTSTGGLIAFCLATKYSLLKLKELYIRPQNFFKKAWWKHIPGTGCFSNIVSAKYESKTIHREIDKIISKIFKNLESNGQPLTHENATLLDLHNLLNHQHSRNVPVTIDSDQTTTIQTPRTDQRDKVLLITAYNATASAVTVFNTSYPEHHPYLVADVLKATMAAPTYFAPKRIPRPPRVLNTYNTRNNGNDVFIDGGVFANDPELAAIWAIRMKWKRSVNYRIMSIGTGCYNPQLDENTRGGYWTWLMKPSKPGLVVQTLMDATRSLTETVVNNLAQFNSVRRVKFNYKLKRSMELDDLKFPEKFDREWPNLVTQEDLQALTYFYSRYIKNSDQ